MTLTFKSVFLTAVLSFSLIGLTGCGTNSKKRKNSGDPSVSSTYNGDDSGMELELNGDSDSAKAGGLRTVRFGFNSARLSSSARSALDGNAAYLKDKSDVEINIEGHCDERGGVQYNLALGEKRAKATKQYLVSQGVSSRRISVISFGKERPVSFGHEESSWSQNRRANFVVTAK